MATEAPAPPSSSASPVRPASPAPRPELRGTRSFTRLETADGTVADPLSSSLSNLRSGPVLEETQLVEALPVPVDESEDEEPSSAVSILPEGFDELPPEIVTLADRFIDSLKKPVHPAPLTVTALSEIFQQFYATAAQAVNTHVSNSYLSLASKRAKKAAPTQMLSRAEISQKKKDRKLLDARRVALEESVEKRVTEGVYDRIWRHKMADDEARDDTLHSKIAALKVVGVKLGHLGIELDSPEKQEAVDTELLVAVKDLAEMNSKRYPLGKVALLKQAHKTIVDCLTKHIATTSADSLLPALIYALIISPPDPPLNAVSNLLFTNRFRTSHFIDGETAYCLTNLEAAISFLETVDLATLKISDSNGLTPPSDVWIPAEDPLAHLTQKLTRAHTTIASSSTTSLPATTTTTAASASATPDSNKSRRLPILVPIDLAATAATTAVSTADQGIRGIGSALENSYKFLFERRGDDVPRTLEDARKLVENPTNPAAAAMQRLDSTDSTTLSAPSPPISRPASVVNHVPTPTLDPLKTIGTSLGRFAGIGMRGFTRERKKEPEPEEKEVKDLLATFPELKEELVGREGGEAGDGKPKELETKEKIAVDVKWEKVGDVRELRIGEVEELLNEYRRVVIELRRRGLV